MPFGDLIEWQIRHDIPSGMSGPDAAAYVRERVEAGTDPVVNDPSQHPAVIGLALASAGLTVGEHAEQFAQLIDTIDPTL